MRQAAQWLVAARNELAVATRDKGTLKRCTTRGGVDKVGRTLRIGGKGPLGSRGDRHGGRCGHRCGRREAPQGVLPRGQLGRLTQLWLHMLQGPRGSRCRRGGTCRRDRRRRYRVARTGYLAAGSDPQKRLDAKVALTRPRYRHGYSREQIIRLCRFPVPVPVSVDVPVRTFVPGVLPPRMRPSGLHIRVGVRESPPPCHTTVSVSVPGTIRAYRGPPFTAPVLRCAAPRGRCRTRGGPRPALRLPGS